MGAAGSEDEELDFRLIFGEDERDCTPPEPGLQGQDLDPDELSICRKMTAEDLPSSSFAAHQPLGIPRPSLGYRAGMHSPPPRPAPVADPNDTYESQPARYVQLGGGSRILECPSIQITTISPAEEGVYANGWDPGPLRDHLYLPLDPYSYREALMSPSPASSHSSLSFFSSEASSCDSLQQMCEDLDSELNEAASRCTLGSPAGSPQPWGDQWPRSPSLSPCPSPREDSWPGPASRSPSPCGKRRRSVSELQPTSPALLSGRGDSGMVEEGSPIDRDPTTTLPQPVEADNIPQKARKTSTEQTVALVRQEEVAGGGEDTTASYPQFRKENGTMDYLAVPSPLAWAKARIGGHIPIFRSSALPPLDWPLPSQYDQYELKVDVQPRTHHRAHYETEGSRGAVKASPGGHPIVKLIGYSEKPLTLQMFIGTADERNLRPHAFYQVHRITGKMVSTSSYEAVTGGTKVLEMSLLPENGMASNIDCAGILKLRNSDIELRKGETDIGRKNTRVRLVFRVHVPQGSGKVVSLQAASIPIECSQRSAQELPQIESYNITACSVNGREEMVVSGLNFLPESKVIFLEKGPDGKLQWEEEAEVKRQKSNEHILFLEVPEYGNKRITRPLQVHFYISNGRRKRSPMQAFKYLPVIFKEEPSQELPVSPFPSLSFSPPCLFPLPPETGPFECASPKMDMSPSYACLSPAPPHCHKFCDLPMDKSCYPPQPSGSGNPSHSLPALSDCRELYGGSFPETPPLSYEQPPAYSENNHSIMGSHLIGPVSHSSHMMPTGSHHPVSSSSHVEVLPPSPVPWSPQPPAYNANHLGYSGAPQLFSRSSTLSPNCFIPPVGGDLVEGPQEDEKEATDLTLHVPACPAPPGELMPSSCSFPLPDLTQNYVPSDPPPPCHVLPSPATNSPLSISPTFPTAPVDFHPLPQPEVERGAAQKPDHGIKNAICVELSSSSSQAPDAEEGCGSPTPGSYSDPFRGAPVEGITLEEVSEIIDRDLGEFPETQPPEKQT
ncbi:nuclear factor of activated T-cells, cytoplasmic 4 [Microcaecilia unicolor]|uniref:Nuclear factor of activated T-cells, cytoplasmic 4 n=1 Tax=Microcaecilia unicolor TaxID=1415580 RepID=A0A6P7WZW3_9AMPH|nr:nuclear factor of activated T-cells, cytoplasmic 4 [Microcaecilia unicolor]